MSEEFLGGGEIRPDPHWKMPWHSHRLHELIVVLNGRMLLEADGREVWAEAGDLLFYRAGLAHRETSDRRSPVNTVYLSFRADEKLADTLPLVSRDQEGRVRQMALWMIRDHEAGQTEMALKPLLQSLLGEMRRLRASPADPWLEGVRRYMRKNLSKPVYLENVARAGGMSKFAFTRRFQRVAGRTPMQELQRMRLDEAKTLLLTTGLPAKAVAAAVGLNDEYQMSKLFRRRLGISPRELRTRLRGNASV